MERIAKKQTAEEFKEVMLDRAYEVLLRERDVKNREEFDKLNDPMGAAAQRWHEYCDPKVSKDLSMVEFDCENTYSDDSELYGELIGKGNGFQSIGDFNFVGVYAGGDWENPVYYILYLDNDDKVRGYVPTEGNVFNKKLKSAFGNTHAYENSEYNDVIAAKEQYGLEVDDEEGFGQLDEYFDWEKMKEDIVKNIQVQ